MKAKPLIYILAILLIVVLLISLVANQAPLKDIPPQQAEVALERDAYRDNPSEEVKAVGSRINQIRQEQQSYQSQIDNNLSQIHRELQSLQHKFQGIQATSQRDKKQQKHKLLEPEASALAAGREAIAPINEGYQDLATLQPSWLWIEDQSQAVAANLGTDLELTKREALTSAVLKEATEDTSQRAARPTIPPATIIEGITLTAVIGRLPVKGKVNEPWPVKIMSTAKGYAPNGYALNTAQMVWEGQAFGDANFECARIVLTRVSSVLAENRIHYIEAKDANKGLAYITDLQGNPCLSGKLISNAAKRLTTEAVFGFAQGASKAYADSEYTRSVSAEGNVVESLTGDRVRALIGQAFAQSADNVRNYLASRYDVWDAIYVAPNKKVVINVDQPLDFSPDKNEKLFDISQFTFDIGHRAERRLD